MRLSLWVLNVSATLFGLLSCINVLPLQLVTFLMMSFFRAFLFSAMSNFVVDSFGFAHFGKLWGLVFSIAGVINIGLYFLTQLVYHALNGNFFCANVGLTSVSAALFLFPLWWWNYAKSGIARKAAG
jgi:LAT3 family solute carrier family 43 protein 1